MDFEYSPFLIDPIAAWDFDGVKREVTVVAIEQTGKTLSWGCGLLWSYENKPCISQVVYKSDEKAEEMNKDKLEPLMKNVKWMKDELALPRSHRKDHYNFSTLKSYFKGSGTRITSTSSKICIADELDDWQEHEGQVSNLDDLRKRMRSFDESMLYKVCSPKQGGILNDSPIWNEFLDGSQGFWHLRCQGCGELTIRSCDTHHLQFESEEYHVQKGSCRLICPKCTHRHNESSKIAMNAEGGYVHKYQDRINEKPSFQWGCLASRFVDFNWDNVAQAQLDAGSTGKLEKQILFDNSFRGLPFKERRRDGKSESKLKTRCIPVPHADNILYRLMSIDTQDYSFWWRVRAYDKKRNSFGIISGQAENVEELKKVWDDVYLGGQCNAGIIDVGGHRAKEVANWANKKDGMFMYKGRGQLVMQRWEISKEINKLILVNPNIYKAELLYTMYDRMFGEYEGWYLEPELQEDYLIQMLDHKPDNKKRDGNKYVNWISTGNDHLFDCEKMLMPLDDYYFTRYMASLKKKSQPKRN